jgi:hypothetical protein
LGKTKTKALWTGKKMLGILLSQNSHHIIRRAAFDIGSGATKVQCSDYKFPESHEIDGTMTNIVYAEERPVPFGADFLSSQDGYLSERIQLRGLQTLSELKEKAVIQGAKQFSAIATEVFRKAKNGEAYLERVRLLGIDVVIITQELEAELGHQTALINSGCLDPNICVWDSGGSSFQISTHSDSLQTYMASIGSSTCASYLAEIKNILRTEKTTPNPVTLEESNQLIEKITSLLPSNIPNWLTRNPSTAVLSVCGKNSIFKVCCNVLDELSKGPLHMATTPPGIYRRDTAPELVSETITAFTLRDAERALVTCLDSTDEVLCKFVNFQYSDGPKIIVPKLCLLVAVMRYLKIDYVSTVKCTGSCSGVIIDNRFWTQDTEMLPTPLPPPLLSSPTHFP